MFWGSAKAMMHRQLTRSLWMHEYGKERARKIRLLYYVIDLSIDLCRGGMRSVLHFSKELRSSRQLSVTMPAWLASVGQIAATIIMKKTKSREEGNKAVEKLEEEGQARRSNWMSEKTVFPCHHRYHGRTRWVKKSRNKKPLHSATRERGTCLKKIPLP